MEGVARKAQKGEPAERFAPEDRGLAPESNLRPMVRANVSCPEWSSTDISLILP
jgi:hypothetical protein